MTRQPTATDRALDWTRRHCRLISDSRCPRSRAAKVAVWAFEYPDAEVKDFGQEIATDLAAYGAAHFPELLESMSNLLYTDHGGASLRMDREGAVWHLDAVPPAEVRDAWVDQEGGHLDK